MRIYERKTFLDKNTYLFCMKKEALMVVLLIVFALFILFGPDPDTVVAYVRWRLATL